MIERVELSANSAADQKSAGKTFLHYCRARARQLLYWSGGIPISTSARTPGGPLTNQSVICIGRMAVRFSTFKSFLAMPVTGKWGRNGIRARRWVWAGVRRMLLSAAPTCTLWSYDLYLDAWRFGPWPWLCLGLDGYLFRTKHGVNVVPATAVCHQNSLTMVASS